LSFEVGDFNIDLGRGATGAYIRKKDQFQVWLTSIELVDLDLNYHYWTFANLWNLAFGRFSTINSSTNIDQIANIVSIFLNTELTITEFPKTKKSILTLTVSGENFKNLILSFYESNGKFYVQYLFHEIYNNPVLEAFAQKTKNNLFEISKTAMEKIKNATQK